RLLQYVSAYGPKELILTGGTAINKIYLKDKARFSEDADFELKHKAKINELINSLSRIVDKAKDFSGTEKRILKIYYQVDFLYKSLDQIDKVRLDVAFNEVAQRRSELITEEITSPFSEERVYGLSAYGLEELLARKLYAIYRRTEGKDIYDLFYGLELANKHKLYEASERFFRYKKLTFDKSVLEITQKLRGIKHGYIAPRVNNYIPLRLRPKDWEIVSNSIADYISNL
ncbi:MAG: nucleotidyl transferase AbiEii/AbiGii toxin family protein, partial [Candidatus Acidifodinimicrobium sp.]